MPVLRLLKLQFPKSEIYWWISKQLVPLLDNDPDLTGIFPFERGRWTTPHFWWELAGTVRRMRALSFDWVIDLQSLARSGAIAWLSSGKLSIGLDDAREGARGFYDIAIARPSFKTHAAEWYLEALRRLQVPLHWNFDWIPFRRDILSTIEHKWNPGIGPWIVVNPGARWTNKRWPVEYYRELVTSLIQSDPNLKIAILGQSEDHALGAQLANNNPTRCLNLAGKTSLPEMIEWIRLSRLVVTNDTGPMHVAAAIGKPTVSIFGPTNPHRTGPLHQMQGVLRGTLPCAPCLKPHCTSPTPLECMHQITPDRVLSAVQERLSKLA